MRKNIKDKMDLLKHKAVRKAYIGIAHWMDNFTNLVLVGLKPCISFMVASL
jgi:hypothetical protein